MLQTTNGLIENVNLKDTNFKNSLTKSIETLIIWKSEVDTIES